MIDLAARLHQANRRDRAKGKLFRRGAEMRSILAERIRHRRQAWDLWVDGEISRTMLVGWIDVGRFG